MLREMPLSLIMGLGVLTLITWLWESWSCTSPGGSSLWGLGLPAQLSPRHTSWALAWPSLSSTPSMTCCSLWRDWSYWTLASESLWLLQQQDVQEEFQWGSSGDGVPEARPLNQTNLLQWIVVGRIEWTKGYTVWHTAAPNATKMNEKAGRGEKKMEILFCFGLN